MKSKLGSLKIDTKAIYIHLDAIRGHHKTTWRQMANLLDVPASTFSRIKAGRHPSAIVLAKFLVFTGVPIESFIKVPK